MKDEIMNAVNFFYDSQGYVDLSLVSKMANTPEMVVENVLNQEGFVKVDDTNQFIKNPELLKTKE